MLFFPWLNIKIISCIFLVFIILSLSASPVICKNKNSKLQKDMVEMTLADSVFLALRKNRTIKSAYLDRTLQKFNLEVAEAKFRPVLNIDLSTQYASSRDVSSKSASVSGSASAKVTQNVPTGGQFIFTWANTEDRKIQPSRENSYTTSFGITFTQPFLKGGGFETATASVDIARLTEQINILSLKSTVIDTVTSTIFAYRRFMQAKRQLEISKHAFERAKELLEINKALIAAGRIPKMEIIQAEAEVANREFAVLTAEKNFEAARLSLIKVLDIDKNMPIMPIEETDIKFFRPDIALCETLALKNRADYLQTNLQLQVAELNLLVAKNDRLWNLSLDTSYNISGTDSSAGNAWDLKKKDWNIGLKLNIPIGDLTIQQNYINAKINMEKTKVRQEEVRETVEVEVINAVSEVEKAIKQVELARRMRELAEKKLEIEMEKLKAGRSTNFQIITFQNDMVIAQNNEIDAAIAYSNALTVLDKTIGTTLETWKIEIKENQSE